MSDEIEVFTEEANAGLTDLIRENFVTASTQLLQDINPIDPKLLDKISFATDLSLADLFPVKGILATAGEINLNGDYFDIPEVVNAKNTPIDKPFDYDHKASDIIGHMTGSWISDHQGNLLSDDAKLPEVFDVGFTAVLYRHYPDNKVKQARADKIIATLKEPKDDDKWFVSMECRFKGFDYLMLEEGDSISNAKLIKRNNDTAFLTKHLKWYGGTGSYKGNIVARVFRNLTFSGIGLVRQPGNPRSVISTSSAGRNYEKIDNVLGTLGYEKNNEEIMNELETIKELKAELTKAQAKNLELVTETAKADWTKKVSDLQVVVEGLNKDLGVAKANVEAAKQEAEVAKTSILTFENEKKELVKQLDEFKTSAAKAEAARVKLERVGKVKEAYSITDEAKADQLVVAFSALTDEAFAVHIDTIKSIVKPTVVTPVVDATVLNKAKPVVEVNLAVAGSNKDEDNAKTLAAEMLAWAGNVEEVDEEVAEAKVKKTKVRNKK